MDTKEAGRLGAAITNTKLTTEGRRKAAKKGWSKRKARLKYIEAKHKIGETITRAFPDL